MTITFESVMQDGLLTVTTSGHDDSLQQVMDYSNALIKLALHHDARRILCDERNLEYALSTIDTYELAKALSNNAPRLLRAAVVCQPKFLAEGKFWETVAVNRGLQVRIDTDIERARAWVLQSSAQPAET